MEYIKEMISVNMLISIFNFEWIKKNQQNQTTIKCNKMYTNTDNKS